MKHLLCACDEIIVKSEGGIAKIRSRIMIVRHDKVYAVCKSCGVEVAVPLQPVQQKDHLVLPVSDAPALPAGPPLILTK